MPAYPRAPIQQAPSVPTGAPSAPTWRDRITDFMTPTPQPGLTARGIPTRGGDIELEFSAGGAPLRPYTLAEKVQRAMQPSSVQIAEPDPDNPRVTRYRSAPPPDVNRELAPLPPPIGQATIPQPSRTKVKEQAIGDHAAALQAEADAKTPGADAVQPGQFLKGLVGTQRRVLGGGLSTHFTPTADPWNPSGKARSLADMVNDMRARDFIEAGHQQRVGEIEANAFANDPMRKKLAAERLNRAYEEIMPYDDRPLIASGENQPGTFFYDEAGAIANAPPMARFGQQQAIDMASAMEAERTRPAMAVMREFAKQMEAAKQLQPDERAAAEKEIERRMMLIQKLLNPKLNFSDILRGDEGADLSNLGPPPPQR